MRHLVLAVILTGLTLIAGPGFAEEASNENAYTVLLNPAPVEVPGKIEVVEVFWYGCPHCYHFESDINPWIAKLPKDVNFVRIPAIFGGPWDAHAQLFVTLETLGVESQVRAAVFDAIQKQRKRLVTAQEAAEFLSTQGVNKEQFLKTYDSFGVKGQMAKDKRLLLAYGVEGVPSLIVNGKYRIDLAAAGGPEQALKVADQLINKERATR